MFARIYRPTKTAMQSGRAGTKDWVLDFEDRAARQIDPLMGWTSSTDTLSQVQLAFDTKEQAIAYAERHGIAYRVVEPKERRAKVKAYGDNFKFERRVPWSH